MTHCDFEKLEEHDGCISVVCRNCGFSKKCIKRIPFRRVCVHDSQKNGTAGTCLKKLLSATGITVLDGCKCNARAMHMNAMGNDWCEQNIETIIEWLKEEATARGLPFFAMPARILVRRAIANARKESRRAKEPDQ